MDIMTGEVSIGGVYLPSLVFLGIVALVLFGFISSLLSILGIYRIFVHRPLVDVALLIVLMGVVVACSANFQLLSL
jgi:hypothetical protein